MSEIELDQVGWDPRAQLRRRKLKQDDPRYQATLKIVNTIDMHIENIVNNDTQLGYEHGGARALTREVRNLYTAMYNWYLTFKKDTYSDPELRSSSFSFFQKIQGRAFELSTTKDSAVIASTFNTYGEYKYDEQFRQPLRRVALNLY